jgi:23S rRNA pseudouridine1911/1915/1917 synthase
MDILYSDNRILVCLKPAGVLSTDEAGGMPELLRAHLGDERACVRTVHRLDRPVGGVMVFARSRMAASILSQQVRERRFSKEYLAVAEGVLPEKEGRMEDLLVRDTYAEKTLVAAAPGKDVQPAALRCRVLAELDGLSLVLVTLETGRTHQIRAQFSARGLPLAGDKKYGASREGPLALWSYRLSFDHPQTGERLTFSHLPPEDGFFAAFSPAAMQ